jgi:Tfp pilus assembly protein PilN
MSSVRINFLPRSYQPPKQLGFKEWGIAGAVALAVVLTGTFYANTYAAAMNMERKASADQAMQQQVKAKLAEATGIKTREDRVAEAEADIQALAGRRWSDILLTLRELTPQEIAWTSLKVEGSNIVLTGTSRGLVDVAQLFGGLVDHTGVEQVSLRYVDEKGIPVTMVLKPGDKQPPQPQQQQQAQQPQPQQQPAGGGQSVTFSQLEFEMVITLSPSEGRQKPYGA